MIMNPLKKFPNKKAFTLTEVMVTIAIIGATAGLAMPRYTAKMEAARAQDAVQVLTTLLASQNRSFIENGVYQGSVGGTLLSAANLDVSYGAVNNFNEPLVHNLQTVGGTANVVASIMRTGDIYRLKVSTTAGITCDTGSADYCRSLGF